MSVYYNEIDKYCAAWLKNLMDAGEIPHGVIDTRSIEDVIPSELAGFTQCHFFAGLGGWAYALKLAGWGTRPVWTGSCPCQPFSAAGKGAGFADERHLWPAWQHLIAQCRPAVVFGEQVASKDADAWIDLVHADMEGMGYAFGCVPFPAAGVGAPHIRDRNYWVADTSGQGSSEQWRQWDEPARSAAHSVSDRMAHSDGRNASAERQQRSGEQRQQPQDGTAGRMADADGAGSQPREWYDSIARHGNTSAATGSNDELVGQRGARPRQRAEQSAPSSTNALHGHWRAADWLACTDGKWRPVSASPQPLVDGVSIGLGSVRSDQLQEIEGEVNAWEMETGFGRTQALRDLWRSAHEAAPRIWTTGRIPGLHEAPFLLAFVRQLALQGWGISECISVSGTEVPEGRMRVLWNDIGTARAPCELRLEGQPSREYPDAMRVLSSILARHAHKAWAIAHSAYAETCFPLTHGSFSRVGRLRAYGNAIVPQAAQAFIESYCEARGLSS